MFDKNVLASVSLWHICSAVVRFVMNPKGFQVRVLNPVSGFDGRLRYLELYVGDNEGDIAWMRSDLLRSYAESSCAALFGCVNIILLAPLFASHSCHFPVLIAMSRK